ncbi:LytR/AlgR family response regulator transcription factor [Crocinitomix catalasitica]|uniref:LytR/AlgR family response regulator transcription factor n=1 Tax=Crocinitomix catalasitica TaxID=184607 RepID=UPI000483B91E|nr:LytTR family DNA-binding domain-containing protein [Crocinitomix catalasitica]
MNCLIIDDDPLICDLIKHFCSKQNWIESCISVSDGNQAVQAVNTQDFDLIFLDYNLPDLNAKSLLSLLPDIPVIMITTEESFGAGSYAFKQVIDFIVKPVNYDRFLQALMRFKSKLPEKEKNLQNRLVVKEGNSTVIIKTDEIRYIKSESNYVVFFLEDKKVMALMSLKKLVEELPKQFIRIHKSFIINLNFLERISTEEVLVNSEHIPIGLTYKEILLEKIKDWQ